MIDGKLFLKQGWPSGPVIGTALHASQRLLRAGLSEEDVLAQLEAVRNDPAPWIEDPALGKVAKEWARLLNREREPERPRLRDEPVAVPTWGQHLIESGALEQMHHAARLPIARAAALMPDSQVGYGLPIGGVLAVENAVIPYAVGVDIACRMHLTIFEESPLLLDKKARKFERALLNQTRFGMGSQWESGERPDHEVMEDAGWEAMPLLRQLKGKAWVQLGTSGTGNHFVNFGILVLEADAPDLGVQAGKYLALLSHSGSRGVGAQVANVYTKLARAQHPKLDKQVEHLAWLTMDSEGGQEYWLAMTLAGRYAAANHEIIHERVAHAARLTPIATVQNAHNFAWEDKLPDGTPVFVHRKGATPAGAGVLGIIPGSMADPGYVVRGKGNVASLHSASHGAGRRFGRREAMRRVDPKLWQKTLHERRVTLLGGSLDESPQAYKPIDEVMAAQADLVEVVARFEPRLVRMAEGSDRPED